MAENNPTGNEANTSPITPSEQPTTSNAPEQSIPNYTPVPSPSLDDARQSQQHPTGQSQQAQQLQQPFEQLQQQSQHNEHAPQSQSNTQQQLPYEQQHYSTQQPYSDVQQAQPYGQAQQQVQQSPFYDQSQQQAQPYGQAHQQPQSYGQAQQPYENQYAQQPFPSYGQQTAYQEYPPVQPPMQPPYQSQTPPPPSPEQKRRVWPWVLCVCLVIAAFGLGGCVGCVAGSGLTSYDSRDNGYNNYNNIPDNDLEGYLNDQFGYNDSSATETYTLDELKESAKDLPSKVENGNYTSGLYIVGQDIDPGLYYLEGSQTEEANYYLFKSAGSSTYELKVPVVYLGNYYVQLTDGDAFILMAPEAAHMYKANNESKSEGAPYQSGCYRVGIDIAPGTYKVTAQSGVTGDLSQEAAAYIMKDLFFGSDSILSEYYVMQGGSHEIVLEEGQYLELFAATLTPVQQ